MAEEGQNNAQNSTLRYHKTKFRRAQKTPVAMKYLLMSCNILQSLTPARPSTSTMPRPWSTDESTEGDKKSPASTKASGEGCKDLFSVKSLR